jgi:hypothetical protein
MALSAAGLVHLRHALAMLLEARRRPNSHSLTMPLHYAAVMRWQRPCRRRSHSPAIPLLRRRRRVCTLSLPVPPPPSLAVMAEELLHTRKAFAKMSVDRSVLVPHMYTHMLW